MSFMEKGYLFNNAYIWASERERDKTDKNLLSAICYCVCLRCRGIPLYGREVCLYDRMVVDRCRRGRYLGARIRDRIGQENIKAINSEYGLFSVNGREAKVILRGHLLIIVFGSCIR